MSINLKDVHSIINKFQGEYSRVHFNLISDYLFDGRNSSIKDLDCNLIFLYLILRSLKSLKEKNHKYNYDELYNNKFDPIIIKKSEIAAELNYPRETVRRKINNLIKHDYIKMKNNEIIINTYNYLESINIKRYEERINKCLDVIIRNLKDKNVNKTSISLKKNFSLIWYNFLQLSIFISKIWKEHHSSMECWYVYGMCSWNQMTNSKDSNYKMLEKNNTSNFYLSLTTKKNSRGLNPTTLSELTGIPRQTVMRNLQLLIKNKTIKRNKDNLYFLDRNTSQKKNIIKNLELIHKQASIFCFELIKVSN